MESSGKRVSLLSVYLTEGGRAMLHAYHFRGCVGLMIPVRMQWELMALWVVGELRRWERLTLTLDFGEAV